MIKIIVFFTMVLLLFKCNAQDSSRKSINLPNPFPKNVKFIKVVGTKYEYKGQERLEKNVRLSNIENNLILYEKLDSLNNLIYTVVCKPMVQEFLMSMVGDSIPYVSLDTAKDVKDSVIIKDTYQYYIKLVKDGKYVSFYPNGTIYVAGIYQHNNKNGEWIIYNENGKIIRKEIWNDDKLEKKIEIIGE